MRLVQTMGMIAIGSWIAVPVQAAEPDDGANAEAIADEYAAGKGRNVRELTAAELAGLSRKGREELALALDAYVRVASERGAQGLEGLIASTAAALARTGAEGWRMAEDRMVELADVYWIDESLDRPNAVIAVKRPQQPALHFLPTPFVRSVLERQLTIAAFDLDDAIENDLCSEAGIAAFEQRWGTENAALLEQMCDRMGAGGSGGLGAGLGIGALGEASVFDCFGAHEQTRSERIEQAMQDCFESSQGGGGNPVADSPTMQEILRMNWHNQPPEMSEGEETYDEYGYPVTEYTYGDEHGSTTYREYEGGSVTVIERDADGNVDIVVEYDGEGNMMRGTAYDEDGNRTESVQMNDDGGYTVTRYDEDGNPTEIQRYDENAQPVDENGNPETPESGDPGMDWGETAECRELTLALMLERAEGLLEQGGVDPTVVNPDPDAPVEDGGELDCLTLDAGALVDDSFECQDDVKLCAFEQSRAADCSCQPLVAGMKASEQCGIYMRCADGLPELVDGVCSCGSAEIFVDIGGEPGPIPVPIDLVGIEGGD